MSYVKFLMTLVSIPIGIFWLLSLNLFFKFFGITNRQTQIEWISAVRCLYFRIVCSILRIDTSHFTSQKLSTHPDLVILNHHSFLDIFVIGCTFRGWFLAKAEVRKWPLIGTLAALGGVVFVNRESIQSRINAIFMLRKLGLHGGICLFPEGTTTSNIYPKLEHWNHGGFATLIRDKKVVVQTHAISYLEHEFHAWEGDKDFVGHLLEICKKQKIVVNLRSIEVEMNGLKLREARNFSHRTYRQVTKLALANHKNFHELKKPQDVSSMFYRTT